jgi:mannosylfructose-phosphate synthase
MDSRKRIAMVSTHGYVSADVEFGKPDTGGQVVFVLELSKCLARFGYAVDIFTRQFENQPAVEEVAPHVQILRYPCGGHDFIPKETLAHHLLAWKKNAMADLQKRGYRYSFVNSHYWDGGIAGAAIASHFEVPHIHTPHSLGAWKRQNMDGEAEALEIEYNFRERIREERYLFHNADMVIATTPQQREILLAEEYELDHEKVKVIPPGYDDTRFFPVSNASRTALKHQYGYEGRIVMALGRLARNKGYDLLVEAMPEVLKRHEDVTLVLSAGSTEYNQAEQALYDHIVSRGEELGISDRIRFADYIPDDELPDYYRLADVFCLCSRYEPFGMTAVEAMASGTPTVVTTEGGLQERLDWGQNAVYANPFDAYEYGSAIHHLLQHPRVWSKLSRNGAHKARADFTWIGIAQQTLRQIETPEPVEA